MLAIIRGKNTTDPKPPYTPPAIQPIGDRIVVQIDLLPEITKGGIALPNNVVGKRASRIGTVVAVGPGQLRPEPFWISGDDGMAHPSDRYAMQTRVGDCVVLPQWVDRVQMDLDDEQSELAYLSESDLLAILPPDESAVEAAAEEDDLPAE